MHADAAGSCMQASSLFLLLLFLLLLVSAAFAFPFCRLPQAIVSCGSLGWSVSCVERRPISCERIYINHPLTSYQLSASVAPVMNGILTARPYLLLRTGSLTQLCW